MQFIQKSETVICRLDPDEEVLTTLTALLNNEHIHTGIITAIGAIRDPELGYYDTVEKTYLHKKFNGNFEVLSLMGNITLVEGKPFIHAHIVLGGKDFSVIGGHLFKATVAATLEICIQPVEYVITRIPSPMPELKIMKFPDGE